MQALGLLYSNADLSFSLKANVSLSNQFAKGFLQVGCSAELRQWQNCSRTLEFLKCKRRQMSGNFGTSNSLRSCSWLVQ